MVAGTLKNEGTVRRIVGGTPRAMIKVGDKGETGDVEISDILFAAEWPVAGAVLVEWNIRASKAGSAGMWGE